eukprot:TRINITY_DN5283_c0_g1_i1.p1 TRINITY_DN5283_c0_g1~~TRINITY_DN5283_c0_g1_i1.p1  ORF type:complete len:182 (+),score=35.16 TRINITY_DN5283_c0_g1_i1:22-567(+)
MDSVKQRITIVLRDAPENVQEEDVRALFVNDGKWFLKFIKEVRIEFGHTAFIRFVDEKVTLAAWEFLRDKVILGFPVLAHITSFTNDAVYPLSTPLYEGFRSGGKGRRNTGEGPYRGKVRGRYGRRGESSCHGRSTKHSNTKDNQYPGHKGDDKKQKELFSITKERKTYVLKMWCVCWRMK